MINAERVTEALHRHYPRLEQLDDRLFRAYDEHLGVKYAVRYFDLRDDLVEIASRLQQYQEMLLGESYFSPDSGVDLRWNHYLYFVASASQSRQSDFRWLKASLEADRKYARKRVVLEDDLEHVLPSAPVPSDEASGLPQDIMSDWLQVLEGAHLGYVLDDALQVPAVARHVISGTAPGSTSPPRVADLSEAEQAAAHDFISALSIREFRQHPIRREFDFGSVNLIVGSNGAGKTSLLEAIEYLYCGKVLRSDRVMPDTVVSAILERSGLRLETGTHSPQSSLRARHLAWYRKHELKKITVHESFGKFNFLNTDAAVRLTLESSKEQIGSDVAQLLLGAQAGKALDRLQRVERELEGQRAVLEKEIELRRQKQADAQSRADALLESPRTADVVFHELSGFLRTLGWRQPLVTPELVPELNRQLRSVAADIEVLQRLSESVLPQGITGAHEQQEMWRRAVEEAEELAQRESARAERLTVVERRIGVLRRRMTAVDALVPILASGLNHLLERQAELGLAIGDATNRLRRMHSVDSDVPLGEGYALMALSDAAAESRRRTEAHRERCEQARSALRGLEAAQSTLVSLYEQLRTAARQILSQQENQSRCPLCHTNVGQGEFFRRLDLDGAMPLEEEARRCRIAYDASEKAAATAQAEQEVLSALVEFIGAHSADQVTLGAAWESLRAAQQQLVIDQEELRQISAHLAALGDSGITAERMQELTQEASRGRAVTSAEELALVRSEIEAELADALGHQDALEIEEQKLAERRAEIAEAHALDVGNSIQALCAVLRRRLHDCERAAEAVRSASRLMHLPAELSPLELSVRIGQAQALAVQCLAEDARETSAAAELQALREAAEKEAARVRDLALRCGRIKEAHTVLRTISASHSEQRITSQILRENVEQIGRIFVALHAPNEFEVAEGDNGLRIWRRESGAEVELNEMSTGQRAAYALSLFLAMNARLQDGPPVLIFDDPIAQVDDINVLSFLDHLREVALAGQKQVFFATASEKIAGLFRHKFRFLGEEKFREIVLTRKG